MIGQGLCNSDGTSANDLDNWWNKLPLNKQQCEDACDGQTQCVGFVDPDTNAVGPNGCILFFTDLTQVDPSTFPGWTGSAPNGGWDLNGAPSGNNVQEVGGVTTGTGNFGDCYKKPAVITSA